MKREVKILIWVFFVFEFATGCHISNHPPVLAPVGNQKVVVGQTLEIILTANDPDGDNLFFSVEYEDKKINDAHIEKIDKKSARFTWSPIISDASGSGEAYPLTFYVEDGFGGIDQEKIVVTAYRSGGIPEFLIPHGYILDLAQKDYISFEVIVKDDDSASVDIAMQLPIEGAILKKTGKKTAEFYWRPSQEQIMEKMFYTVIFTANDFDHDLVLHQVGIILVNTGADVKCPGSQPQIIAFPASDQSGGSEIKVKAKIDDADSIIQYATLMWRVRHVWGEKPEFQAKAMLPDQGDLYSVKIPAPDSSSSKGVIVDYFFSVTDNDDITSDMCDHTTRFPKEQFLSMGFSQDATGSVCFDDDIEPLENENEPYQLANSFKHDMRLCSDDSDWFSVYAEAGNTIYVSVSNNGYSGIIDITLTDSSGTIVATSESATGDANLKFTVSGSDIQQFKIKISSASQDNLFYQLSFTQNSQTCINDTFENNNSIPQATVVNDGTYKNLMICPEDIDIYKIPVEAGTNIAVDIAFSNIQGDLDLLLLGPDGTEELAYSESESDNESITFANDQFPYVYAAVYGFQDETNVYDLTIKTGSDVDLCIDDYLAPNQNQAQTQILIEGSYPDLTLCPSTQDWFQVGLNGGETFNVYVLPDTAPEKVKIELFDEQGNKIVGANDEIYDDYKFIEAKIDKPGNYVYSITSQSLKKINYELDIWADEDKETCHNDRFEPNNSPKEATPILTGINTYLKICGTDSDWFKIKLNAWQPVTIYALFYNDKGDIDIYLYDTDFTTLLDYSDSTDKNTETIDFTPEAQGEYYIQVKGKGVKDTFYDFAILEN